MDGWYYKLFGIEFGPVSIEKLVELINVRSLGRHDEVCFGANGKWRRVGSIGPLMTHLPFEASEKVVAETAISAGPAKSWSQPIRPSAPVDVTPELEGLDLDSLEVYDPA